MPIQYVTTTTTRLRTDRGTFELLWGDPCHIIRSQGNQREVWARGMRGLVDRTALGSDPGLLELYVIDVGQGDGVLFKTPDGRWHLVDAGVANEDQDLRKGAANFIRWKFYEDLRQNRVQLENVFISHSDYDHYGGLIDLLAGRLPAYGTRPARTFDVRVENLYHNGMGRFAAAPRLGRTHAGTVAPFPRGHHGIRTSGTFITELLGSKGSFRNPARSFGRPFDRLAALVGRIPRRVRRLDASDGFVPGYGQGATCAMHVLGPVVERFGNRRGLRTLGGQSKTRNGHSIVLRLDFGRARILLTGDLNTKSQRLLLSYLPELDFTCDVAKACHHGSADVDMGFLQAMAARATISSSGDNESYAHPRPRVLGASGLYGRAGVDHRGRAMPPLLYSTELARSVELDYVVDYDVDFTDDAGDWTLEGVQPSDVRLHTGRDRRTDRPAGTTPVAVEMVYGLVNVRTDGREILFATMHESGKQFDHEVMRAGISP